MNDPISDMLARIRNANRALLPDVELPHSRIKESIAGILKKILRIKNNKMLNYHVLLYRFG